MIHNDYQTHHRRSIRLKGYDYSLEGAYFVTTVTRGRECIFGKIVNGGMHLSKYGKIVLIALEELPRHFPNIELNEYVIMPNHVHIIIVIKDSGRGGSRQLSKTITGDYAPDRIILPDTNKTRPYTRLPITLSEIVRSFKSFSARRINIMRQSTGSAVWQRNYYERIIRNEGELKAIYDYIYANPRQWAEDEENPVIKADRIGKS